MTPAFFPQPSPYLYIGNLLRKSNSHSFRETFFGNVLSRNADFPTALPYPILVPSRPMARDCNRCCRILNQASKTGIGISISGIRGKTLGILDNIEILCNFAWHSYYNLCPIKQMKRVVTTRVWHLLWKNSPT